MDGATVMPWSSDDTAELLARAWGLPVNEVRLRLEANSRRLIGAIQRAA
nr:hypothetical protein [Pseudomonas aeruginosa]